MASEMMKAILEVEEECRRKEADAVKKADEKKTDALLKARKLVSDAEAEAELLLQKQQNEQSDEYEIRLKKSREVFEKSSEEISKKAEKNRNRVAQLVVGYLTQN